MERLCRFHTPARHKFPQLRRHLSEHRLPLVNPLLNGIDGLRDTTGCLALEAQVPLDGRLRFEASCPSAVAPAREFPSGPQEGLDLEAGYNHSWPITGSRLRRRSKAGGTLEGRMVRRQWTSTDEVNATVID
jgi:hypothetical protein